MQANETTVEALAAGEATADPPDAENQDARSDPAAPDDASLLRELISKAYPDSVPELIRGETLGELLASIPTAQAAYARIAEAARDGAAGSAQRAEQITVPAGAAVRSTSVNVEGLTPMAKIRAGLAKA